MHDMTVIDKCSKRPKQMVIYLGGLWAGQLPKLWIHLHCHLHKTWNIGYLSKLSILCDVWRDRCWQIKLSTHCHHPPPSGSYVCVVDTCPKQQLTCCARSRKPWWSWPQFQSGCSACHVDASTFAFHSSKCLLYNDPPLLPSSSVSAPLSCFGVMVNGKAWPM